MNKKKGNISNKLEIGCCFPKSGKLDFPTAQHDELINCMQHIGFQADKASENLIKTRNKGDTTVITNTTNIQGGSFVGSVVTGDHNDVTVTLEQVYAAIDSQTALPEKKEEAKNILKKLSESQILSGAAAAIFNIIAKKLGVA